MMIRLRSGALLACTALCAYAAPSYAQPQPEAAPMPPAIPAPQDKPFPGTLKLHVDATDTFHHVMSVHETIPVPKDAADSGDMVLLYPKWVPGAHAPEGPIDQFGGLVVKIGGKVVPWKRDTVDVYAFHIPVKPGQTTLDADFQLLSPVTDREGRVVMTPRIVNVQWDEVSLYPAGYYSRQIPVQASVRLPHGWQIGTALRPSGAPSGDTTTFGVESFNTLVDSPIFAGAYFRKVALNAPGGVPVTLNMVADKPADLNYNDEQLQIHRNLVKQAILTFGSQHYKHYDFLMALTDELGGIGLEHHQSSEDSVSEDYFTDWKHSFPQRDLLAHEYTHSWNGKYRRPADLYGPSFNSPQRGSLLWVYEGQTQYWGNVLAARSGLVSKEQGFDALALMAASYDNQAGRAWRPVLDTTNDPIIAQRAPLSWRDWQRSEDYYVEGQLVWLDVDTTIRKLSNDKLSLDDFTKRFFGTNDGSFIVSPYRFEDVVSTLNEVVPYDWATFLRTRIEQVQPRAPLDGLKNGGYRLIYNDTPNDFLAQGDKNRHRLNLMLSIGFSVRPKTNSLLAVHWGGPAFKAGLAPHDVIVAVNGDAFTPEILTDAIKAAKDPKAKPIELLVQSGSHFRTVSIPYHGGLRYPHLERIAGTPDRLTAIYTAR